MDPTMAVWCGSDWSGQVWIGFLQGERMATKTTSIISPNGDRNFRQAHIETMVEYQRSLAVGYVATYSEIVEVIGAKGKEEARDIFLAAMPITRRLYQIHFKNRRGEGYQRVSGPIALEHSKKRVRRGYREIGRGCDEMHDLDRKELTDSQQAEVAGYLSMHGRLQLMMDTSD